MMFTGVEYGVRSEGGRGSGVFSCLNNVPISGLSQETGQTSGHLHGSPHPFKPLNFTALGDPRVRGLRPLTGARAPNALFV